MSIEVVKNYKLPKGCDLGLKVYYADGRPHSNKASSDFRWPVTLAKGKAVVVSAPDWRADSECGGGLHVWRWGEGGFDASPLSDRDDATVLWAAVEYVSAGAVDLSGKVKVSSGKVVAIGSRREIATWIATMAPNGVRVAWGTATAGTRGTATAGYAGTATAGTRGTATAGYAGTATAGDAGTATAGTRGTATAGDAGTATAGDAGTATAGYAGTATAGDNGTATAGDDGTATAGTRGTATAGDGGTATAGDAGTATAGDAGTATAGYAGTATAGTRGTATAGTRGTATAGDAGTATAGTRGTATAGYDGVISILWWDGQAQKYRRQVGVIDGVTLKPWTRYTLDSVGQWVEGATLPEAERPEAVLAAAYAKAKK